MMNLPAQTSLTPSLGVYHGQERRRKQRINSPFLTAVEGTDADHKAFQSEVRLASISAAGLYFHFPRRLETGTKLSMVVNLSNPLAAPQEGACLRLKGVVLRVDNIADETYGVAVAFARYSFF